MYVRPDGAPQQGQAAQAAVHAATTEALQHHIARTLFRVATLGTFVTLPVKTKQGAPFQSASGDKADDAGGFA